MQTGTKEGHSNRFMIKLTSQMCIFQKSDTSTENKNKEQKD